MKCLSGSRRRHATHITPCVQRSFTLLAGLSTSLVIAILLALLVPGGAATHAEKGGKGGGGSDPSPVLPAVRYWLTWLDWGEGWGTRAKDMNDSGQVVGYAFELENREHRRAFVYESAMGLLDLNNLPDAEWRDLDSGPATPPTTDWIARNAEGINELREIVGTAEHVVTIVGTAEHFVTLERRAFVLMYPEDSPPQFLLLPHIGVGDNYGYGLNDVGDIVGFYWGQEDTPTILYSPLPTWPWYSGEDLGFDSGTRAQINDAGVIVTLGGYRSKPGVPVEHFPDHRFWGINQGIDTPALISGVRDHIRSKGKVVQEGGAIRISENDQYGDAAEILMSGDLSSAAYDVNDRGDVSIRLGYLYTDVLIDPEDPSGGSFGLLDLDDLVLNPDNDWFDSNVFPYSLTNPDMATGFPAICGYRQGNRAFVLMPVPY